MGPTARKESSRPFPISPGEEQFADGDKHAGWWNDDVMDEMGRMEHSDGDSFQSLLHASDGLFGTPADPRHVAAAATGGSLSSLSASPIGVKKRARSRKDSTTSSLHTPTTTGTSSATKEHKGRQPTRKFALPTGNVTKMGPPARKKASKEEEQFLHQQQQHLLFSGSRRSRSSRGVGASSLNPHASPRSLLGGLIEPKDGRPMGGGGDLLPCQGPTGPPSVRRTFHDGEYEGQIVGDGRRHGYGVMQFVDGDKYAGWWNDDVMDGMGRMEYNDGDKYEGNFKAGLLNGQGTYHYASGNTYEGEWHNDQCDGHGVYTDSSGSRYVGSWRQDMMEGRGRYVDAFGNQYVGDFRAGKFGGKGVICYAGGNIYDGDFHAGMKEGRGILHNSDGSHYKGLWKEDRRDGWGIMYDAMGGRYKGEFRENLRHGRGIYQWPEGDVDCSTYEGDQRKGVGVAWSADRKKSWRLMDGQVDAEVSPSEAALIAKRLSIPVPK